ncbi:MAG: inositol monophosphatase family protein [Chitinophagales bacterium]
MKEFVSVAVDAARRAGELVRERFGAAHEIERKGATDFVTEADRSSEALIRGLLAAEFPGHAILGEEEGAAGPLVAGYRWIIDPLDGTTNFIHGFERVAVSIALERAGELAVGVVYSPLLDELYVAEAGSGAFLTRGDAPPERLRVSTTPELLGALLATGFPYEPDPDRRNVAEAVAVLEEARDLRRLGSAALDLCDVARGRYDGYFEHDIHAWDVAAGALMVVEAGGRVTARDGGRFRVEDGYCLATNGRIHDALLQLFARIP